ncbi:insulin-like growth factor-binding protein complex acid labile subunit [Ptychodera flava]|uniref:insulin-like growth factor-binding protein complex acid labile subunit n=1 Tax=Ptychodera flava TaxID=63121 RepID=UPI00396A7828
MCEVSLWKMLQHCFTLFLLVISLWKCETEPICKVYNTTYVDCSGRELHYLPQKIPSYTTYLDLTTNKIVSLPPNGFVTLKQLDCLDISANHISRISSMSLQALNNLKLLNFHRNNISIIASDAFQDLSKLEVLVLSFNRITKLPDKLFSQLKTLTELDLSSNFFLVLSVQIFRGLDNLQSLLLKDTGISSLPDGIFESLTNLKELHLHGNKMTCFPNKALQVLSNIETVLFDENEFDTTCSDINLENLQKLSLELCFLKDDIVPNIIFSNKRQYGMYQAMQNPQSKQGTYSDMKNVSEMSVYLSNNKINSDSLERLLYDFQYSGVTRLDLTEQYGRLSAINVTTLRGLKETKLTVLHLSSNALLSLLSGVFQWLPYLEQLHISKNALNHITVDAFVGLHSLKTLRLNENQLYAFSIGTFSGLKQLTTLDLRGNHFNKLPELFQSMNELTTLTYLHLSFNDFEGEIPANFTTPLFSLKDLDIAYNSFTSIHNDSFSNLTRLQLLDISYNWIRSFPEQVFYPLSSLKSLSLIGNKLSRLDFNGIHPFRYANKLENLSLTFFNAELLHLGDVPSLKHLFLENSNSPCVPFRFLQVVLLPTIHKLEIQEICVFDDMTSMPTQLVPVEILALRNVIFHQTSNFISFLKLFPYTKWFFMNSVTGLTSIDDLPKTQNMETLILMGTQLANLDTEWLKSQNNLHNAEIKSNGFDCSKCNMKNFYNWMETDKITKLDMSGCGTPESMKRKSLYSLEFGLECNQAFLISVPITCVAVFLTVTCNPLSLAYTLCYFPWKA